MSQFKLRVIVGVFLFLLFYLSGLERASGQTVVNEGEDISTRINNGFNDLSMAGNVTWNNPLNNQSRVANLIIEGNGNTIAVRPNMYMAELISSNANITIRNANITQASTITTGGNYLFGFVGANWNSYVNLEGTTFSNFFFERYKNGGLFSISGNNHTVTIDGGAEGAYFTGNRAQNDSGAVFSVEAGNLIVNGKVVFDSNWSGNYGGVMNIYEAANNVRFTGEATFTNNHAVVFGGAIDVWGGNNSNLTFDGTTVFDGNYVYYESGTNPNSPPHVTDQNPRGGAMNIGYIGSGPTIVTFNGDVSFLNNYVVNTDSGKRAMGGAVSVYGNGPAKNYQLYFKAGAIFDGNYAASINGLSDGGAIFYDSSAALLSLSSGTSFTNNYAGRYGGGIYLQEGSIELTAISGDIIFQGNRHGVQFDSSYAPIAGTGTPNAIYLGNNGSLSFTADAGYTIHFYDPIASSAGSTINVTKAGLGEVIFYGDGGQTTDYDTAVRGTTTVGAGFFTLANGVQYGDANSGAFLVQNTGTLRGGANSRLVASSLTVQNGGTLGVTGGLFTLNSSTISMAAGSIFTGNGTLAATSAITLGGQVSANIDEDDSLIISALLTGSGGLAKTGDGNLTLSNVNTYTGATTVSTGTLSTAAANAFAQSSQVTIAAGASLIMNNYDQTANNLAGAGDIELGSGTLTANNSTDTIFSGQISGSGQLVKTGANSLTLSGDSSYSGGTAINSGRLIATTGPALGTGTVNNSSELELNFNSDGTLSNLLTGPGSLYKTGTGTATLTNDSSIVGNVYVQAGTLALAQNGIFTAGAFSISDGATTQIGADAQLTASSLSMVDGATLSVYAGSNNNPAITTGSATIAGNLVVTGIDASGPAKASDLASQIFTVIDSATDISGEFFSVSFDEASAVDYLTLYGGKSADNRKYNVGLQLTWLAGTNLAHGDYTLDANKTFEVDVVLADQSGTFTSTWDGKSLTKKGDGNLILSAVNTYTGATNIQAGTLTAGIANAFAQSSQVDISAGATLNMAGFDQTAKNLTGGGNITLGGGTLTADNDADDTIFSGVISGTGELVKTGTESLTLSGQNTYSGGTTVSAGRLVAQNGSALGTGAVDNNSELELNFSGPETFANQLTGTGDLYKTGAGTATLTYASTISGNVLVQEGTLSLAQSGVFTAGEFSTADGATTRIATGSQLQATDFSMVNGANLAVTVGGTSPAINTGTADIAGNLTVTGLDTSAPSKASLLANQNFTVINSGTAINGEFSSVDFGGAASAVDYLTLYGGKSADNLQYNVGLQLTWLTGVNQAHGDFTLAPDTTFEVDVVLADQSGTFTSTWDGKSLTKKGDGNLILSAVNTYTGATNIQAGTLTAGIANAFAQSSQVDISAGATLNMAGFDQTAKNLTGGGNITLGGGTLTADNDADDTTFSGVISGTGGLIKDGGFDLTLSGINTFTGGITISDGRLIATAASALSTGQIVNNSELELNFSGSETFANQLTGTGDLYKTGTGTATLTSTSSSVGDVFVEAGTLYLAQDGTFNAQNLSTSSGATLQIGADSQLTVASLTQDSGSNLSVYIGPDNDPAITTGSADIAGNLYISGVNSSGPPKASELMNQNFTVIDSVTAIGGDFDNIYFGSATNPADYLTLSGSKSADLLQYNVGLQLTWLTGVNQAHGDFTLAPDTTFEVDVVLADQSGTFTSSWDGQSLTKKGDGNLILSAVNTYTGATNIQAGTLTAGIANAFAQSSQVDISAGATLNMAGFDQTAKNLTGGGNITLGGGTLTADNDADDTTFSGVISGTGGLIKDGGFDLTLSGINTFTGGITISDGRLIATAASALSTGQIVNNSELELNFSGSETFANQLTGTGDLYKTGTGTATLTSTSSSVGDVFVEAGTLYLAQDGTFNAQNLSTSSGATLQIGADSQLTVASLTQDSGSNLSVYIGPDNDPAITTGSADIAGNLYISGVNSSGPPKASELMNQNFTVIDSVTAIGGDFDNIYFGSATNPADYLTLSGSKSADLLQYNVGLQLTWLTGVNQAHGDFTLAPDTTFEVDVVLADQSGTFTSSWDGQSLTKKGDGNLILSAVNTYTGATNIQAGTLTAGIANAFAQSSQVDISAGATLDMAGFDQTAKNLTGGGNITLGGGTLTADNDADDTIFSGVISGTGDLVKTGTESLTLSGQNTYSGGTTVSAGRLVAQNGSALGTGAVDNNSELELNFSGSETFANQLTGTGDLYKTGTGTATLTSTGSSMGTVSVQGGTLYLAQEGTFTAGAYTTTGTGSTTISDKSILNVTGAFTQEAGSTLNAMIGLNEPLITANAANLAGTLSIAGFDTTLPASALTANRHTIIESATAINGDFTTVDFGGITSGVDYLLLDGAVDAGGLSYSVGFALTWTSGPATAHGNFTMLDEANVFNVDIKLEDQTGPFTSNWNGRDLTKSGDGTLILSVANSYSGITTVDGGVLSLTHDTALGLSSQLTVNDGALVALNGTSQTVGKLEANTGSIIWFDGGTLTISDTQRQPGDTDGGYIEGNTLFGSGNLIIEPSIVYAYGANTGFTGDVTVTGGSELIMSDVAGVGNTGTVTLAGADDLLVFTELNSQTANGFFSKTLAGTGTTRTETGADVTLNADNSAYAGTFDIQADSTLRASEANHLGQAAVDLAGTLVLTSAADWTLTNTVTGAGDLVKQGAAHLQIYDSLAGFGGSTFINEGALVVGDAVSTNVTLGGQSVAIAAGGILSGTGTVAGEVTNNGTIAAYNALGGASPGSNLTVGRLTNAGTINLFGSNVGNTLTVVGGMTSQSGRLILASIIGNDNSPTDRLILDGGATTGTTDVVIINRGGLGNNTQTGLMVVQAINGATTSPDAFVLSPDSSGYRSTHGTLAIGAYDYSLIRGGNGGEAQSWYLTSISSETGVLPPAQVRPEAGLYMANRSAAESLVRSTLYDRLMSYQTLIDPDTGQIITGAAWGRVDGGRTVSRAGRNSLKTTSDSLKFSTGVDLLGWNDVDYGLFKTGLMFNFGRIKNRSQSTADAGYKAYGDLNGYSVGLYATWFQKADRREGFYTDLWVQRSWFDNKVKGIGLPEHSYSSRMWSTSLEGGYSFTLSESENSAWSFSPVFQAIYNRFDGDTVDPGLTVIKAQDNDNWITRLGGRFHGRIETDSGLSFSPYLEANWLHNSADQAIWMDQDVVHSDRPKNTAEIKLGLSSEVAEGLSANIGLVTEFGSDKYRYTGGQVGLRFEW